MYYNLNLGNKTGAELTLAFQTMPTDVTLLDFGSGNTLSTYNEDYKFVAYALRWLPESVTAIDFTQVLRLLRADQLETIVSSLPLSVTSLNLRNCYSNLSPEDLEIIFAALPKKVTTLDLSNNYVSLTSEAIKALPDSVTSLNLSTNVLFGQKQLLKIFKDLPHNLAHLNLSNNGIALLLNKSYIVDGFKDLPSNVTSIDLSDNFFPNLPDVLTDTIKAFPQSVTSIGFSQKEINSLRGETLVKFLTAIPANIKSIVIDGQSMAIGKFQNIQTIQLKIKVLIGLEPQLLNIKKKTEELHNRKFDTASLAANKLYGTLIELEKKYKEDTIDYLDFKGQSTQAIIEARTELELHRGWKEVLGNLALCVLGCGILYAAACLYKGSFFKFNTDSANKLDILQENIDASVSSTVNM